RHIELSLKRPRVDGKEHLADFQVGAVSEMNLDDTSGNLRLDRNHFAGDKLADGVEIHGNILSDRGSDGYRRRRPFESRLRLFAAADDEESGKQDRNERTVDQMVMVSYHDVFPASAEKSTAPPARRARPLRPCNRRPELWDEDGASRQRRYDGQTRRSDRGGPASRVILRLSPRLSGIPRIWLPKHW